MTPMMNNLFFIVYPPLVNLKIEFFPIASVEREILTSFLEISGGPPLPHGILPALSAKLLQGSL
jgi:hypothetical protein